VKPLNQLKYGFADAENYKRRENKDIFNQIFLRTDELDQLQNPSTFFLVGEKGTGKTAYAVYLTSTPSEEKKFSHKFIRETDYLKFISMKKSQSLALSEYVDVWKVIFLTLVAGSIVEKEKKPLIFRNDKFEKLEEAINSYYANAFSPEVVSGLQIAENASEILRLMLGVGKSSIGYDAAQETKVVSDYSRFQTSLLDIERKFEEAIRSTKLKSDHIVFIDGIDIRPESVPFDECLLCVKGMANALWSLNNDFFPSIKDSAGRCRIVGLLRPDIFNSLGMQNRNTKLKDNSVVLDWRTSYTNYRQSKLFKMADKFFAVQQHEKPDEGFAWNNYFPFDATEVKEIHVSPSSFITVLRYTFHRPRDVFAIFDTLNNLYVKSGRAVDSFNADHINSREFKKSFGTYMLGEVKDSLSFYYDDAEYELFLKFFEFLDGHAKFDYSKFLSAFADFKKTIADKRSDVPDFMETAETFLQFLYDQNIICYIEDAGDERFIRWCFIERSISNISPKVKIDAQYEIHYSLGNALNTGKVIRSSRGSATAVVKPSKSGFFEGRVKMYMPDKSYGFIIQDGMPVDVFVHAKRVIGGGKLSKGDRVRFRLEKDNLNRLMAVDVMKI